MKKVFALLILLTVLPVVAIAGAEASSQLDASAAEEMGRKYLSEKSGLDDEKLSTYIVAEVYRKEGEDGTPIWVVRFMGDRNDPAYFTNTYTIYVDARDGSFLQMSEPSIPNLVTRAFNELSDKQGQLFVSWTLEQKYEFSQTFPQVVEDFKALAREDGKNYVPISSYLWTLLDYDFRLPDESCISKEAATEFAKAALEKSENFTEDYVLMRFVNEYSFLYSYEFVQEGRLVWKVFFIPAPPDSPDYGYYVEIDAHTGETVGIRHRIQDPVTDEWALVYE